MTLDLQVNGFGGVDFNSDELTAHGLHAACEQVRGNGAAHILATIITDAVDTMRARLRRIVELRETDSLVREMIVGLHVEGPFLNETAGFIGAHPTEHARLADVETMKRLLDAGGGLVRLVTLAPERDPGCATTRFLATESVVISAGHCDPTLDQLRAAIDAGLTMFTHLGNGCPMQLHRHDNIIQRALSLSEKLWLCFIADGVHVPLFALANYFRAAGLDHCIAVTDAISAAGLGPGRYTLGRWDLEIGDDLVAWGPGRAHLVGSTATMNRVRDNLEAMGLGAVDIDLLMIGNPRRALRLGDPSPLMPVT